MTVRAKKIHPALKHAGYSAATLLPGEDRDAFHKLQRDLIAEFQPIGALELDIVATIARYLWRKTNLQTFRLAQLARGHTDALHSKGQREVSEDPAEKEASAPYFAASKQSERQARRDLREAYEFVEIGNTATVDELNNLLAVEEYLDGLVEKCIKRLLHVRGVKSLIPSAPSTIPQQECIPTISEEGSC